MSETSDLEEALQKLSDSSANDSLKLAFDALQDLMRESIRSLEGRVGKEKARKVIDKAIRVAKEKEDGFCPHCGRIYEDE